MEEYIKVKDLVDMLEQRLVFQEEHGFYRDAGYTSRFIDSISNIPRADVMAKSEYDELKEQLSRSQMENLHLREDYGDLMTRYLAAEIEIAKKIFADIEFGANTNYETPVGTFVTIHTGVYDALKKKYQKEN